VKPADGVKWDKAVQINRT